MYSAVVSDRRNLLYVGVMFLLIMSFAMWNWEIKKDLSVTGRLGTTTYKHELCVLTRVKDISYLLPQWIEYHTNVGVDHIYIANDCSTDNGKTMFWTKFYAEHYLVTLYESQDFNNCTYHVPNESVLFDFLFQKAKNACEWVTVIDADEYMVPTNSQESVQLFERGTSHAAHKLRLPLKQLIHTLNKQSQPILRMPWYIMSTHGLEMRPSGFITTAYTNGQYAQIRKTLVKSEYVNHWIDSHAPQKYVWNLPRVQGRKFKDYARSFVVTDNEFSAQKVRVSGSAAECVDYQQRRYLRDVAVLHAHNSTAHMYPHNSSSTTHHHQNRSHVPATTSNTSIVYCTRTVECILPESPLSIYHYQALSWQDYESIRASRVLDSTGIQNGWGVNARALWLGFNYTYDVCSERNQHYLHWANQIMEQSIKSKLAQYAEMRRNLDFNLHNTSATSLAPNLTQYYLQFLNGDILY